jgi:predicted transcriptional regulator
MSVTIPFPPEIEARLREQAAAAGKAVDAYIREAVEEKLATADVPNESAEKSREQWFKDFNAWMTEVAALAHRYPRGYVADDSRESIYEGRGE